MTDKYIIKEWDPKTLEKKLNPKIVEMLKKYHCILSGSLVTSSYTDMINYEPTDYDIYTHNVFIQEILEKLINECGYIISNINLSSPYNSSLFFKNKINMRITLEKEYLKNENGKMFDFANSIDIMVIDRDTPLHSVIENFDLTFCRNWYNGIHIYSYNKNDVVNKEGELLPDYVKLYCKGNKFIINRITKYTKRGFTIKIPKKCEKEIDKSDTTGNTEHIVIKKQILKQFTDEVNPLVRNHTSNPVITKIFNYNEQSIYLMRDITLFLSRFNDFTFKELEDNMKLYVGNDYGYYIAQLLDIEKMYEDNDEVNVFNAIWPMRQIGVIQERSRDIYKKNKEKYYISLNKQLILMRKYYQKYNKMVGEQLESENDKDYSFLNQHFTRDEKEYKLPIENITIDGTKTGTDLITMDDYTIDEWLAQDSKNFVYLSQGNDAKIHEYIGLSNYDDLNKIVTVVIKLAVNYLTERGFNSDRLINDQNNKYIYECFPDRTVNKTEIYVNTTLLGSETYCAKRDLHAMFKSKNRVVIFQHSKIINNTIDVNATFSSCKSKKIIIYKIKKTNYIPGEVILKPTHKHKYVMKDTMNLPEKQMSHRLRVKSLNRTNKHYKKGVVNNKPKPKNTLKKLKMQNSQRKQGRYLSRQPVPRGTRF